MKIRKISIANYKVFKGEFEVSFPLNREPIVFVGVNGAGKTTIIEAIIGSLWEFYTKIQGKRTTNSELFERSKINKDTSRNAKVELYWNHNDEELITGFEIDNIPKQKKKLIGSPRVAKFIDTLEEDLNFYKKEAMFPILVNYPVERAVLNPSLKAKKFNRENQFDAYTESLSNNVNYNDFFEWFRSIEDLENEIRLNKDNTYSDIGLDAVRNAILTFLDQYTKIRVKRTDIVSMVLEKDGLEYEFNQLSHGEKALIALVGDLARRLVIANPGKINSLSGNGIVFIDELDLHLHPNWQRNILSKLTNTFPNIQFICTTHSSLILNHLKTESIYILENGACYPLKDKYGDFNSYGAKIEDVLTVIQGIDNLLPAEIKDLFDKLHEVLNDGKVEDAKEIADKLELLTGPNQADLKVAMMQMKYKDLLNQG